MAQSKVTIISKAFTLLGKAPVSAIDYTNPIQSAIADLYDSLVLNEFSAGEPWRFCVGTKALTQIIQTPINGWKYVYQLPANLLRIVRTYNSAFSTIYYDINEDKLLTNESSVKIDYLFNVNPVYFPPTFYMLMVYETAAHGAMPITQSSAIAKIWIDKAEKQRLIAEYVDSISVPNISFSAGDLYQSRRSGVSSRAIY